MLAFLLPDQSKTKSVWGRRCQRGHVPMNCTCGCWLFDWLRRLENQQKDVKSQSKSPAKGEPKRHGAFRYDRITNWCSFHTGDDVTVGKFYATYLIQEYFRRFKARQKAEDQANEIPGDSTVALQVKSNKLRKNPSDNTSSQVFSSLARIVNLSSVL